MELALKLLLQTNIFIFTPSYEGPNELKIEQLICDVCMWLPIICTKLSGKMSEGPGLSAGARV